MSLKKKLVIIQFLFILIVVGGSFGLYTIFAQRIYIYTQSNEMEKQCNLLTSQKLLDRMDSEEFEAFEDLAGQNHFRVTIYDEKGTLLYSNRLKTKKEEVKSFRTFKNDAKASLNEKQKRIVIKKKMIEDGRIFYVQMQENIGSVMLGFDYTSRFLIVIFLITLIAGCMLLVIVSGKIVNFVQRIDNVTRKITKNDFDERLEDKFNCIEFNSLATNINTMSSNLSDYINTLEKQNEQLEKTDEIRRDFIGNVSHQLKTPILIISGYTEMLQEMGDKIDQKYYLNSISEETDRMAKMVNNLLYLLSEEIELNEMVMSEMNIINVLQEQINQYSALYKMKNIKFDKKLPASPVYVIGEKNYLGNAFDNIMLNAYQHTPEQGVISINAMIENEWILIQFYNEGERIPEENMDKIWNSYVKFGESRENVVKNSGLGLFIVKKLMIAHHGEYGVDNQDKGVTFWVRLPIIKKEEKE